MIVLPPVLESRLKSPVKVIARRNEIVPLVVVRFPAIETGPAPFCVNAPATDMLPVEVNVPLLVNVAAPPPVVVKVPDRVMPLPVTCTPLAPVVS